VNEAETRQVLTSLSWTTYDTILSNNKEEEKDEGSTAIMIVTVLITMTVTTMKTII